MSRIYFVRAAAVAKRRVSINIDSDDIAIAPATPVAAATSGGITISNPLMIKYGNTAWSAVNI